MAIAEVARVTLNGYEYDFDSVVNLMDDEIREALHAESIEDPQQFVDEYVEAHEAKYGETFEV